MKERFHITLPLICFLTPVLLWLVLLIVLPHVELLRMSLRTEETWWQACLGCCQLHEFF